MSWSAAEQAIERAKRGMLCVPVNESTEVTVSQHAYVAKLEAVARQARVYCSGAADNLANRVALRIALDELDKEE